MVNVYSYYRPQRSYEGYVFTGVSVCPRGGSAPGLSAPGGSSPGGCLLLGVCSLGGSAPGGGVCSRGVGIPACTEADTPLRETATAADGTHPTGMHSCCQCFCMDSMFMYRVKGLCKFMNKNSLIMLLIKLLMMPVMWIFAVCIINIFCMQFSIEFLNCNILKDFKKRFQMYLCGMFAMNCFCIKQILGN